jgi:hypothetical protein
MMVGITVTQRQAWLVQNAATKLLSVQGIPDTDVKRLYSVFPSLCVKLLSVQGIPDTDVKRLYSVFPSLCVPSVSAGNLATSPVPGTVSQMSRGDPGMLLPALIPHHNPWPNSQLVVGSTTPHKKRKAHCNYGMRRPTHTYGFGSTNSMQQNHAGLYSDPGGSQ